MRPARGARHRVHRIPERAGYEREQAYGILDSGWLAHVAFVQDGQPFAIPMLYARDGDALLLHGSIASRLMRSLGAGVECCVTVTHFDGLVLARSHFHHSVNYRSVVAFGRARIIDDPAQKSAALGRFVERMLPGRAADSRPADAQELAATSIAAFEMVDVSAKVRAHGVKDHPDDLELPYWAGVVPMHTAYGVPEPSDERAASMEIPSYLRFCPSPA